MNKITIRTAKPADARVVLDFLNRVGGESDQLLFTENDFHNTTVEQEADIITTMINSSNSTMVLAFDQETVVSVSTLNGSPRTRAAHRTTLALAVSRSHWQRGIGSNVLQKLIAIAREKGLHTIDLEVKADNHAAIHLYQTFGFEEIGRYPDYIKLPDSYCDAILMILKL